MHDSVRTIFPMFTARFEGRVAWMYLDCKGLVTVGLGCLIDPESTARGLPFKHKGTDTPASPDEIGAEWELVKGDQTLAKRGYQAAGKVTRLYLTSADIDALATKRLDNFEQWMVKALPDFQTWPADAQLATLSMCWAMGPGFVKTFKNWLGFAKEKDWTSCAKCCLMRTTGNVGLIPRNKINVKLFEAAARTQEIDRLTGGIL